jgi:SAM-dependent methyltransferase
MEEKISLLQYYTNGSYIETDKGTEHCYIQEYYDKEFSARQHDSLTILEIGIYRGASLDLWGEYFHKSIIHGIDISESFSIRNKNKNIHTHIANANSVDSLNIFENKTFDYIIDDGSHYVGDQLYVIEYWFDKLKDNGKIIIEDIQSDAACDDLRKLSEKLRRNYKVYDMRYYTNRYDDIIFEVTR